MTGKKRLLSVLAAIVALAVSAAPAASAGPSKKQRPRGTAAHSLIHASGGWDPTLARGTRVIASVNVKYT